MIAQLKQAGVRVEKVGIPSTVDDAPDAAKKTPTGALPRVAMLAGTGTRAATMLSATGFSYLLNLGPRTGSALRDLIAKVSA